MIEIKNSNIPKEIKYIIHVSDIHIRNVRRHTEYQEQFQRLYDNIKKYNPEHTVIVISGDIAHAKTDMSPELVREISNLLNELSKLFFVIVFPGNHDANLNNINRLDVLTPIIDNLKNERVLYIKESGVYLISGLYFNLMSVFDTSDRYLPKEELNKIDGYKIGLYHGPVTNAKTDMGFNISGHLGIDYFDGHDIVILGDIHKWQVLQSYSTNGIKKPRIEYAGSLIQQNFGENYENHGYVVWHLESRNSMFVHIDSDYGFHTLTIEDSKLLPYSNPITSKSRVRVKVSNTPKDALNQLISEIKGKYQLEDISVINTKEVKTKQVSDIKIVENNINDIGYQNSLIVEYLEQTGKFVDAKLQSALFDINNEVNNNISVKTTQGNITWKPIKFEFSNMFSYGEGNVIDFTTLSGINGLFGQNATGKSAILDALCFCLFDKTSRAYKAEQVLNTRKEKFNCKLEFQVDGISYFIEKRGYNYVKPGLPPKIKVDIDFWKDDEFGNKVFLNGDERKGTNQIIQEYIGSYDDFITTNLAMQDSSANFINKTQSERKELLARFLNLELFDQLYKKSNEQYKDINLEVKSLEKLNLNDVLLTSKTSLNDYTNKLSEQQVIELDLESNESEKNDLIRKLQSEVKNIEVIDIQAVTRDKKQLLDKEKFILSDIDNVTSKLGIFEGTKTAIQSDIDSINIANVENELSKLNEENKKLAEYKANLKSKKIEIKDKELILEKLKNHQYDPDCKYCVSNPFVESAIKVRDNFDVDKIELSDLEYEIRVLESSISSKQEYYTLQSRYKDANANLIDTITTIHGLQINNSDLVNKLSTVQTKIKELEIAEAKYETNKTLIENNRNIESKISTIHSELSNIKIRLKEVRNLISEISGNIKYLETTITNCNDKLTKYSELLEKAKAYEIYISAVNKEGLPYYMVSKLLPTIEDEINNILGTMVDFKLTLTMDGKNINSYIVYDDNFWPLELCSGMERFMSSMAIRIALSNISVIPRPNFFALDEGLGVLDSTNLNSIYLLFNYMREMYDFTLIISHIDSVRDMVDSSISIALKDGNSFISIN